MVRRKSGFPNDKAGAVKDTARGKRGWSNYLLAFLFGAVATAGSVLLFTWGQSGSAGVAGPEVPSGSGMGKTGQRSVGQLMALSNQELEQADILEMNVAVAREIPGLEKLDYDHYRQVVDGWTDQFRLWLPTVEHAYHQAPEKYKNDINFFRLGMLEQFLDRQIGVAYVEEQKQAQKRGQEEIAYTNPGDLFLHGLIDTKRGTCMTMPTLHVAMGRRLGWPVGLACVGSHYICRYDDGKAVYNIEATDTERGGFAAGTDRDYAEKEGVSPRAIACGSDLRKLTAREMLGVFVAARARHYADTNRPQLAARDYALAHALAPNSRQIYMGLVEHLMDVGERLFASDERGHPGSLLGYLASRYDPSAARGTPGARPGRDPMAELERINAINEANRRKVTQPPGAQPHQQAFPRSPAVDLPGPRRP
jgi:hypothetical protein